ncbi:MAG: DUF3089 domain-containing protein [Candidatus Cryptobacteroides sp.]
MGNKTFIIAVALTLAAVSGCHGQASGPEYDLSGFEIYDDGAGISQEKPDFIYIVSTNVLSATDEDGNEAYTATLTETDRMYYDKEFGFVEANISRGDFNFIAPYYHQFTYSAIDLPEDDFRAVYEEVSDELCRFWDAYVREVNNGRKFVLAGFSQGAMLVLDILKHMDEETYSRMAAAYVIGYRISEEDLGHPHIRAAGGESDTGVAISFNSVLSVEGIWDFVTEGAATCINPVNWKTDGTPAGFTYDSYTGTVRIDTSHNVLTVDINPDKYRKWMEESPVFSNLSHDNLHHWDLLFYTSHIHDNAVLRTGMMSQDL